MNKLLGDVSTDFNNYHFTVVEALENEDDVKAEQEILDEHELSVMELVDRLERVIEVPPKDKPRTENELLRKRIDQVEKGFRIMKGQLDDHGFDVDIYTLRGQHEKIKDLKEKLQDVNTELISVEDSEELEDRRANLEQLLYNLKIDIDRLAGSKEE